MNPLQAEALPVDAGTLLVTLAIVAVVELSSTTRDVDIPDLLETAETAGTGMFKFGRLTLIHLINVFLLNIAYLYNELALQSNPISISSVVLLLLLFILPVIEIEEYDQLLQHPSHSTAFLIHCVLSLGLVAIAYSSPALALISLLIFPLVNTGVFLYQLEKDITNCQLL